MVTTWNSFDNFENETKVSCVAKETGENEIAEESELICTACEKLTALQKERCKVISKFFGKEIIGMSQMQQRNLMK